jgi:Arc/MetJ-type ribon-helix-helix transcriptional regulator
MPKERALTVRVEAELAEKMEVLRVKYGTPFSEQIRRALREWLEAQGVSTKATSRRASTRRKV